MKVPAAYCLLLALFLFAWTSCSRTQEPNIVNNEAATPNSEFLRDKNVLIVYLSRTKNTKAVAEIIQKIVGGKMVALELVTPYPTDYKTTVAQVARENESGYLPPLKTKIDSITNYDVVFVGFPTWGMQLPPPMKSFLREYDLSGKTVIPFNTNGGYGIGNSFETVKELCLSSNVLDGFSTKGGVERDGILFVMEGDKERQVRVEVVKWLEKEGLVKEN